MEELTTQISELTYQIEELKSEVAMLNGGEIYGGTLTDAINFLAESINEKYKK